MLKIILIVFPLVILAFIVIVSMRPEEFRVVRSSTIAAPSGAVFLHVNDLHNWNAWSPWAKMDPNAKMTYSGPEAGAGACYSWAGNKQVGEGRMTITESRSDEFIKLNLEFFKPFKGNSTAEFAFKPDGDRTIITWTMLGKNNFMAKAVSLFMDCEKLVGGQFEQGLAGLNSVVTVTKK